MPDTPPGPRGRGMNILILLILAVLVAGLLGWAFLRNPPDTPRPSSTGIPDSVPPS